MVKNLLKHSQKLLEKQQSSILSAAGIITVAFFLSSVLGLVRNRLLSSYFIHDKFALDAYWVAFRLPDSIFQLLVLGALSAAFIPVYSDYLTKSKKEALLVANSMINAVLGLFILLSIIIFIFAKPLTGLFTGDSFTAQQLQLAANFTRIMLLAQLFFAVSNFLTGIIQANKRFLIPALSPLAYNLGIILGIVVFGPKLGVYGATIGVVIGAFIHFAMQLPLAIKLGFSYQPILDYKHKGVIQISRLMVPRTLALSVNEIEKFAFTFIITSLPLAGAYTFYNFANYLVGFPIRIVGTPIGQASLPFLTQEIANKSYQTFRSTLINSLNQIIYLALPATAILIVLRIPLVRIAYGTKNLLWQDTLLMGKMVALFALGIFAHASIQLLSRAFYAMHDTKTPLFAAIGSVTSNILLGSFLVFQLHYSLLGIAIASSVAAIIHLIILIIPLHVKINGLLTSDLIIPTSKMAVAALIMGICLWMPMRLLDEFVFDTTRTINLIALTFVATLIGGLVYLGLSKLLRIQQLDSYLKLFKKLGNWRKVLSSSDETIDQPSPSI